MWFRDTCTTNNEAEIEALKQGLKWAVEAELSPGEWIVIGD